jgi:hypothetical protein
MSIQPEVAAELWVIAKNPATEDRDRIACLKALLEDLPSESNVNVSGSGLTLVVQSLARPGKDPEAK